MDRVFKAYTPTKRLVFVEAYSPLRPDADGEAMTPEAIEGMAHDYLREGRTRNVDVQHDNRTYPGVAVVQSFIAREDDPVFIPHSWVVGIHINNDELWAKVLSGEINGVSVEALVQKVPAKLEVTIPEVVRGVTSESGEDNHTHAFEVLYSDNGDFQGGRTMETNGHYHAIVRGTATSPPIPIVPGTPVASHTHRFSSVEGYENPVVL